MTSSSRNPIEQTRGGVSGIHMRLWSYVERKLPHHNTQSLMACFHFQLAFHCWDNRKESLGQPLQAGDRAGLRHCSRKDSWRKNAGSDLGVNFSQGFLLKEVFFPAKNSGFFFSFFLGSCSVLLLQQNTAKTFHFLSCLVGCWGDVISELVYVSAGPHFQQNLWHMPVPPVADWIQPGKWRKPQLAKLQKMNFT